MSKLSNFTFDELTIGQKASFGKNVTEQDVVLFAAVSGDVNPVHLDEAFAAETMFGGRIAHGMLSGAVISAALAMELPGPGVIYLGQTLRFTRPVRIGDEVTAHLEVTEKREGKGIFTRLKNLFAGSIINRRLDERLAPIRDTRGTIRRGVRVFDGINRASSASRVPTKEKFLEKKRLVTRSGASVPAYSGSSFQINMQFPTGENKHEMYFLRMDTDTPSRVPNSSRRRGSAVTGNVWYRPESKTRAGIIMQFTPSTNPARSVLKSVYIVYSDTFMKTRNYVPAFEAADGTNDEDAIDADGDGEFDIESGSE